MNEYNNKIEMTIKEYEEAIDFNYKQGLKEGKRLILLKIFNICNHFEKFGYSMSRDRKLSGFWNRTIEMLNVESDNL